MVSYSQKVFPNSQKLIPENAFGLLNSQFFIQKSPISSVKLRDEGCKDTLNGFLTIIRAVVFGCSTYFSYFCLR